MKINVAFEQHFAKTKECEEIITNFGLYDFKENVIIKDFDFDLQYEKIYYLCGYSGSGKTTILQAIAENLTGDIIFIKKWDRLEIPNKPLIEFFADKYPIMERFKVLSTCGLGEAWKFISNYSDLSDGEKFRFVLYHSIMTLRDKPKPILIIDEFCATLDRITAKAIANNIRKLRDKFKITFILASAHDDLTEYLGADFNLFKEFDESIKVT